MATSQNQSVTTKRPNGRQAAEALNRGELVQVLADADMGRIDQEELEEALEQRSKKHWLRQLLNVLLLPR